MSRDRPLPRGAPVSPPRRSAALDGTPRGPHPGERPTYTRGMETFFVVVMALVMLGVGVLALLAVRRLFVIAADDTAKDD